MAALLLGAVILPAQQVSDPDLFAKSLSATQQALAQYGRHDVPEELRRVNDIGYRIARESGFQEFPFTFHLIDMPEPNAFALPGGQIFLTRGMLDLDLDDDMLAGLLGHEIAHVVERHGVRMQKRATLLNALSQALLVGVMIAADDSSRRPADPYYDPRDPRARGSVKGDMIQGTYAAGIVVTELLLRGYSREFEDEADEEGQRWAAGAGFDPDGTRRLMARMEARIPQTKTYGYWRTHPFFDQRVLAAEVRRELLTVQSPRPADDYRSRTQKELLALTDLPKLAPELVELLRWQALNAWPQGELADQLRLDRLHRQREELLAQTELRQDLTALVEAYREEIATVRELTPKSPFITTARQEIEELERLRDERYPSFVETWKQRVFETGFLETFLSNYPESEYADAVALALGDAYSRSRRQTEAVEQYLTAWRAAPDSEAGRRARAGLRNLVPYLDRLSALQRLAEQDDLELARLAEERLQKMASTYKELENGAEYLKRFPDGPYQEPVARRLDALANELLGELLLYQAVGDTVKALERIRVILTHAPLSPAADKLRQRAVLDS
ncbi:MAG: M48 family metalloprotease [Thermoanaerobaculia bacterium]|nr:M48 family metalloprotease [Thermoanaerobaculia bacterium]